MDEPRIRERLQRAVAEQVMPGCVFGSVTKGGKRSLVSVGRCTYAPESPLVTETTVYDVASITKSIPVALLALHFIERGMLSLNDTVITYIPEITRKDAEKGLVRHLLTYAYALQKNPDPTFSYEHATAKDILEFLYTREFEFLPGTAFQYSNTPAALLGIILERISGKPLYTLADEILFSPLALRSATFHPLDASCIPPTEISSWRGEVQGAVHDETASILQSAGYEPGCAGLFSSAGDLLTVAEMLLGEGELHGTRYFSPETVALMHTNQLADVGAAAGLGWELNEPRFMGTQCRPTTFGKTGFTGTSLVIDPERGIAFVLLSNRTYPSRTSADAINQLRRDISDIVLGI